MLRRFLMLILLATPVLAGAGSLRVFVSVLPQQQIAERVGGDQVVVSVMVKPGFEPASYEPNPRQVVELAQADLYARIGVPFEDAWLPRIQAANPAMPVWDMRGDVAQLHDPHVWTDPLRIKDMAARLRDRLTAMRPQQAAAFATNYKAYATELDALHQQLLARLGPYRGRSFLVFHPAWSYFAARYGLHQLSVQHEGKEPGPREMQALIEQAKHLGLTTLFVEPQFHHQSAAAVARGFAGRLVLIDPLAPDLIANLREVSEKMVASWQP